MGELTVGDRVRHKPSGREGAYRGPVMNNKGGGYGASSYPTTDLNEPFLHLFKPDDGQMEEVPLDELERVEKGEAQI